MSAQKLAETDDPLLVRAEPVDAAWDLVSSSALVDSTACRVGLELEFHLVRLTEPARRPSWPEVLAAVDALPAMPAGSTVSVEPGGQVELSTPPAPDAVTAVAALRTDEATLRSALAVIGFGVAALGADPARRAVRVNPAGRYRAMEEHFAAVGCAEPGRSMMSATAALQINLDAGPAAGHADRMRLLATLVPVLVALSATSPWLAGHAAGWHSMRRRAWLGIDPGRTGAVAVAGPGGSPADAWASYVLAAPVMLDRLTMAPVRSRTPFSAWLEGAATDPVLARRPTTADLDYHLSTLFPPVRPRGYVELRCLDALPARWWPALVALTVTLADDQLAADRAAELCEPLAGRERTAARQGLDDPEVWAAVRGCLEVALTRCPTALTPDLEELAELVAAGRTPCGELRRRIEEQGPVRLLEEEARA